VRKLVANFPATAPDVELPSPGHWASLALFLNHSLPSAGGGREAGSAQGASLGVGAEEDVHALILPCLQEACCPNWATPWLSSPSD